MSINNSRVVDFVSLDETAQEVRLTISDHLDWIGPDAEHTALLQAKLNSYLAFIESGEIYKTYPKARGLKPVIQVISLFEIPADADPFVNFAKETVKKAGFDLRFRRLEEIDALVREDPSNRILAGRYYYFDRFWTNIFIGAIFVYIFFAFYFVMLYWDGVPRGLWQNIASVIAICLGGIPVMLAVGLIARLFHKKDHRS